MAASGQKNGWIKICPDLGLIRVAGKNHTVNHTPNKKWGFPKHIHAGKPHSGISGYVYKCD